MFKKIFHFLFYGLVLGLSFLVLEFIFNPGAFSGVQEFIYQKKLASATVPAQAEPQPVYFEWSYAGRLYNFTQTFYGSVNDFFINQEKSFYYLGELPIGWEESYYSIFLRDIKGDDSITELVGHLNSLAQKNNLSAEQTLELAVAFVQSIPYDEALAARVISQSQEENPRYPYEVLYNKKGICSDKSFLLWKIGQRLGYSMALMEYEEANHMAVGIKCPQEYSTDNTGFCFAETTSVGHKIGIVPYLDSASNQALSLTSSIDMTEEKYKKLVGPKIYQISSGKTYTGIAKTIESINQLKLTASALEKDKQKLAELKKETANLEAELNNLGQELNRYKDRGEFETYNQLVPKYNSLSAKVGQSASTYNQKVANYNRLVQEYNLLAESLN